MALIALALLLSASSAAQTAGRPLPLAAAVEAALAASPSLDQAEERLREAGAGLSEARLLALPRLSAKSVVMRGDDPVYAFSALLQQRRFGPQNFAVDALNNPGYLTNVKSSLELGLPLFTGFALRDGRELGRIQVAAAGAGAVASVQAVRYQVTQAYLRALLSRALAASAQERSASASAELEDARRLRARGLVLGSDYYAAEAVLGGLQASKIQAENERAGAESILGVLVRSDGAPVEPLGALGEPSYSTAPLSALLDAALRDRQDLRQAASSESAAAVLARRERLSVLPTVDAFAAVETNTSDFGANPWSRLVGVRASLPIGDPTYFERANRAAAASRGARAGRRALEQAAAIEVRQRFQEHQAAAAMLPVLRESAEKAQKSLELFRPLYREGRQSILDVLRAEDALMKARAGYLEALFRVHAGYAGLRLSVGGLDAGAVSELERGLGGAR